MNLHTLKYTLLSFCALSLVVACSDDDNGPAIVQITCDDGIMNGTETGVDCGGTCEPCEEPTTPVAIDFTGTFAQVDYMGRPGINTVLSPDSDTKNMFNQAIPNQMGAIYQPIFEAQLEGLHDVYAGLLGLNAEDVDYQPNILGDILNGADNDGTMNNPVSATVLTTVLANDVLEIAPDAATTYFNPGSGAPDFTGAIGFTGRTPQDDVIDVSLILLFGGADGARFNGQELEGGGNLPRLVSDGVALTASPSDEFPYLGAPE
ncbi:DUF4331 family protein [Pricia sp.]|uniref:DUF4331 family protein n=1 Tax=Pricia sp. TaxID=2268138 RepID=UPI003592ED2F